MNTHFLHDVDAGLSAITKTLSSKYFYNHKGDALFRKIMAMPEYYLTRAEMEILVEQSFDIIDKISFDPQVSFSLIELGAGDGSKTEHLLSAFLNKNYTFNYVPIDISANTLEILQTSLSKKLPTLSIKAKTGDYFSMLGALQNQEAKLVLFLGSNIGNQSDTQASNFLAKLNDNLETGDYVLLGADLIKAKELVLPAYSDAQGYTSQFNLNLLSRINKELGADFKLEQFKHCATYDGKEGIARSYLVSKIAQKITIAANQKTYFFKKQEKILMEISRKYDVPILEKLLKNTQFDVVHQFTDKQGYFADFLLQKK